MIIMISSSGGSTWIFKYHIWVVSVKFVPYVPQTEQINTMIIYIIIFHI